jgi:transcriptional regulator with XRE-family HTH domain
MSGFKNLNRSEIARATNTDLAHISRIFSGKSRPSLSLAYKIAEHLGITIDDLCQRLGIASEKLS